MRRPRLTVAKMNRVLYEPGELGSDHTVVLSDARAEHILRVLKLEPGGKFRSGTINGLCGVSCLTAIEGNSVTVSFVHDQAPAEPWFDIILAMPRPKVLRRLLPQLSAMGAGNIVLLNAAKIEKSYFSAQVLCESKMRPLLIKGAEQAGTTILPEVLICSHFKPFMEQELPHLFPASLRLLAHPSGSDVTMQQVLTAVAEGQRPLLTIGPEREWSEYELGCFQSEGFKMISWGSRTLRSDTACVALVAVLGWFNKGNMSARW